MYGHRARIGYTSPPAVTETFPYEFYRIVPDGVTLALTTLNIVHMTAGEVEAGARLSIEGARLLRAAGADIVVLGGVPLNLAIGLERLEALMAELSAELGVPVTSSLTSQVAALKALGAKRVGVATPFRDHDIYGDYLRHYGFEMGALEGADRTVLDLASAGPEQAAALARRLVEAGAGIDTLYFPAPHWGIIEIIEPLEREYGLGVVSSVQAIVWNALRLAGVGDAVPGYGRLLREF